MRNVGQDVSVETPDDRGVFNGLKNYFKYEVFGDSFSSKTHDNNFLQAKGPSSLQVQASPISPRPPRGVSIKAKWPAKPPGVSSNAKQEWTKYVEVDHYSNDSLQKFSNFPIILTYREACITTTVL